MQSLGEHHILIFLLQLTVLLLAARGMGELFRRIRQPALVGEILVGIILGPTILGRLIPGLEGILFFTHDIAAPSVPQAIQKTMFETVSWLGVFFLLLVTGFEVDASVIWRERRSSLTVGLSGMLVPMALGIAIAFLLPAGYIGESGSRGAFALLLGTVMGISAIPVIAKVLHDFEILKSDFGLTILASSTLKDILGWMTFTLVLGLATQNRFDWLSLLRVVGGTVLFVVISFTVGRTVVNRIVGWLNRSPLPKPGIVLSFIVILGGLCGTISQAIGIHAAFGFLIAGIMAGEATEISERTRETISQVVNAVFVPLFFVSIGLKVDFFGNFDLLIVSILCVVDIAGKFLGAWLGARLSQKPAHESVAMGVALIPGGAMEIIIAGLALEFGLITIAVFEAVVIAALLSSIVVGPLLLLALGLRRAFNALEFFLGGAVISELSGNTPEEVIGELCSSISTHEGMPGANQSCAAVTLREQIMGTGMEHGIAIPHARMEGLSQPVFTFGRSRKGIEWNTSDGLPVQLVFLVLTPESDKKDIQVKILASIARALEDENLRQDMLKSEVSDAMISAFSAALRRDRMVRATRR